jgi:predicted nucleotidyltransferase
MKQILAEFVLKTSATPPLGSIYRATYIHSINAATKRARKFEGVVDLCLRGSLTKNDWVPGLSDVDLILILDDEISGSAEMLGSISQSLSQPFRRFLLPLDLFVWRKNVFEIALPFYDERILRSPIVSLLTGQTLRAEDHANSEDFRRHRYRRACRTYIRLFEMIELGPKITLHQRWHFFRWLAATNQLLVAGCESDGAVVPQALRDLSIQLQTPCRELANKFWPMAGETLKLLSVGLSESFAAQYPEIESATQSRQILDGRLAAFYRTVWDRNSTLQPLAEHAESFACEDLLTCMRRWRCHFNPPSRYALRRTVHHTLSRWENALSFLGLALQLKDTVRLRSFHNRAANELTDTDIEWIHEVFELPSTLILQNRKAAQ